MAVSSPTTLVEEEWVRSTSGLATAAVTKSGPHAQVPAVHPGVGGANTIIPGPMELGAVGARTAETRASDKRARRDSRSHGTHQCGTLAEWRNGDPIVVPPHRGRCGGRGGRGSRGSGGGLDRAINSMEADSTSSSSGRAMGGLGRVEELGDDYEVEGEVAGKKSLVNSAGCAGSIGGAVLVEGFLGGLVQACP